MVQEHMGNQRQYSLEVYLLHLVVYSLLKRKPPLQRNSLFEPELPGFHGLYRRQHSDPVISLTVLTTKISTIMGYYSWL